MSYNSDISTILSSQLGPCLTPLMLACGKGHGDVVDELLATKSVNLDQLSGVSQCIPQYQYYSIEGNDELVVCYPQDGKITALINASKEGHLHIVKKLIKAGVTVDQQSKVGTHPVTHHH